jgi:hypothetical protein
MRTVDPFGDLARQQRSVRLVAIASQHSIDRGGRVRVRRGDQHPVDGNPGLFVGHLLGPVHQRTGNQQAVDHAGGDPGGAVVQHQASGVQRVDVKSTPASPDVWLRTRAEAHWEVVPINPCEIYPLDIGCWRGDTYPLTKATSIAACSMEGDRTEP